MSDELEIEELRKSKDQAYWERNQLVAALSKLFPAWLSRHPYDDKNWENDWRWIVFIEIPTMEWTGIPDNRVDLTRQLSWHIHDSELPNFAHLTMKENVWDGHSTEEKYRRLQLIREGFHVAKSERHNETTTYTQPSLYPYTNMADVEIIKSVMQAYAERVEVDPDQRTMTYTNMAAVEIIKSIDELSGKRLISETLAEKEQRDTHFTALTRSTIDKMLDQREGRWIDFEEDDKQDSEAYALIIARRMYDLACYVIGEAGISNPASVIHGIPDRPHE